ncbi:bifunctional DNA-binding transcriptional regulator/O6-methylguanine-DNA methyltransferase Ada (plasmid) [Rhizobium sp. TRM96647]|uniref:bifunctional DNA-binding transcriptional regulator/O6-methylguanine-DNA methyltransferase Ada n=1 Tax=unclassified Rhizobium TaxID=2613769 RepID=UPI0021E71FF4|nr:MULTISPECIES: bifunctional DNA-binding transcriptional regulator/O6-methylguanine-DNA methyltransferase Ada [unclassified Rhizobium]MCV3735600.1 bifunctional DNA-binding transcriptional regulator/O6-methylguanine-DNA methyltransferase Ada [Rhizobium sp. TRM96647]MCV3757637.1 bifunctional DNA-binding transcriptional regulator/O6-methylguanine-DNA methyltransferase Ada [Rhizobium sp. TRM96650]
MTEGALKPDPGADTRVDGIWRGVITTGIYCLNSCGSRAPRAENLRRFRSAEEAERAGFRPCRRCRPNEGNVEQRNGEIIAEACRLIEEADDAASVSALAHAVGVSEGHFHRLFRKHTGLTPRAYREQKRAADVREKLVRGRPVTEAFYDAGYGSSGRFYAVTNRSLGMTPRHFRDGGTQETLHFAVGQTSLGAIVVASSPKGIAAILIGDDPETLLRDLQDRFPKAILVGGDADYERTVAQVVGLIEAPNLSKDLPLDIRGTVFQRRVWHALQSVPAGSTVSYDEIARRVGHPRAVSAVASACASNPLAVAIPCHRVVKSDGTFFGYTWGLERKRTLLAREYEATRMTTESLS